MKKLTFRDCGREKDVFIKEGRYANGSTAVALMEFDSMDSPVYCVLSVNIAGASEFLDPGVFFLKDWSENGTLVCAMVEQGIIEEIPGITASSGFVSSVSAYRFTKRTLDVDVATLFAPSIDLI